MALSPDRGGFRTERFIIGLLFTLALALSVVGVTAGWRSLNLPGEEFRQAQTAISTYFIQKDHDFSLAYPTPVLGKPWSIPMEFPLYQWTVAGWMNVSGMDLTQSGRLVSVVCFYLLLPAIFILLGRLGVEPWRRLLAIGLILCCPLYIFYTRAFLIETMALMAAVWFLAAFVEAIKQRSWTWLLVANVAGVMAGSVKVTTFMLYLMPAGVWTIVWLWQERRDRKKWLSVLGWVAGCCVVPFAMTFWWTHYADTVKALNPAGSFLQSGNLSGFNLGTAQTRFAADVWLAHWKLLKLHLFWIPALVICAAGILVIPSKLRSWIGWCFLFFMAVQVLFPVLYALHGYYYVANGIFLMVAMGLVLAGLLAPPMPRWLGYIVIIFVFAGQGGAYLTRQYSSQRLLSLGGNGLSAALKELTLANDTVIIVGDDWSSLTPYYSRRRALMIRSDVEKDAVQLDAALEKLEDERVGAFVVMQESANNKLVQDAVINRFHLDPQPLLTWEGADVFFPKKDWDRVFAIMDNMGFDGVTWGPGINPPSDPMPLGKTTDFNSLTARQKRLFVGMSPRPARVNIEFQASLIGRDHRRFYGAHPDTHLWFQAPPGKRILETGFMIAPEAYKDKEKTDGVLLSIVLNLADGTKQTVFEQFYDPAAWPEDRGYQPVKVEIDVPAGAEIEVSTGPGPKGNKARDWAWLSDLTIK